MTGLITPSGVLVYDGPPVTPAWFAARREGITGTDLPKILGLTKYGNSLSVWRDKRGELDDESEMEAATWGNILEDPVAQEWARRNSTTVTPVGVIAKADDPWVRASLDRIVVTCPDGGGDPLLLRRQGSPVCGLEVKTRSAYKARQYEDDIPDDVLAQVAWGLHATGLEHMHVAVLIGGQRLKSFRVDRDGVLEGYLLEAAEKVWQAVIDGNPPEVHPDAEGILLAQLEEIYRDRQGDVELPVDEALELAAAYRQGVALERQAKAIKTKTKTALVQLLGKGTTALVDGSPLFTFRPPDPTDQVTADSLRAMQAANPELYAALIEEGLITKSTPSPRFNLKRAQAPATSGRN